MFGLIVNLVIKEGQRDSFVRLLRDGVRDLPGCHSYVVAEDVGDARSVWLTEVWDSSDSHDAAALLPGMREALAAALPLVERSAARIITAPVGGIGLGTAAQPSRQH